MDSTIICKRHAAAAQPADHLAQQDAQRPGSLNKSKSRKAIRTSKCTHFTAGISWQEWMIVSAWSFGSCYAACAPISTRRGYIAMVMKSLSRTHVVSPHISRLADPY